MSLVSHRVDSGFVDPRMLRHLQRKSADATVNKKGRVYVPEFNKELSFIDVETCPFEVGTKLKIDLIGGWFQVYTLEAKENHESERWARSYVDSFIYFHKSVQYKNKCLKFNAQFDIPFKWSVGIKDVLSGLSFNSMGNGRNSATVGHVLVLEDVQIGRLKRQAFTFLCTSKSGSDGKNWSGTRFDESGEILTAQDGTSYLHPITCKSCLKKIEHWKTDNKTLINF